MVFNSYRINEEDLSDFNGNKIMVEFIKKYFSIENKGLYFDRDYKNAERKYVKAVLNGELPNPIYNLNLCLIEDIDGLELKLNMSPEFSAKNF